MANYRGNLYNLYEMQENVAMAKNVYEIVTLQYQQGVVAYLNVITAESNLINSQIGYLNALFQVLSNKVDLQKAMGIIYFNH
jgi:outer membrane protein TolC